MDMSVTSWRINGSTSWMFTTGESTLMMVLPNVSVETITYNDYWFSEKQHPLPHSPNNKSQQQQPQKMHTFKKQQEYL